MRKRRAKDRKKGRVEKGEVLRKGARGPGAKKSQPLALSLGKTEVGFHAAGFLASTRKELTYQAMSKYIPQREK